MIPNSLIDSTLLLNIIKKKEGSTPYLKLINVMYVCVFNINFEYVCLPS